MGLVPGFFWKLQKSRPHHLLLHPEPAAARPSAMLAWRPISEPETDHGRARHSIHHLRTQRGG